MNRCGDNARMTMSILLGVIVMEVSAFAGFAPPWGVDPNNTVLPDPNTQSLDWLDRLYGEISQEDRTEIVPWSQETALPSPDNAAVLYYQAFLLRPQMDEATLRRSNAVRGGAQPDPLIRTYLGACRKAIHMAGVASQAPQCTWGIRHLDDGGFNWSSLTSEVWEMALLLDLDARTLAFDGHYDAAFARCLTIRRLARHVGDETMLMLLVSRSIDYLALRTTQHGLGLMAPNADTLSWLRGQLAAVPGAPQSMEKALQSDLELLIASMQEDARLLNWIRQQLAKNAPDETARQKALALTDDEVLAHVRGFYARFLNGVLQILDSDMPYEQKYAEIDAWTGEYRQQYAGDPAGWMLTTNLPEIYSLLVRNTAGFNALKAAVEVYLAYAETGQLPEALPAYTPKDPYSAQAFEYEITATNFILRCRANDLHDNRIWQYEFNVRK